MKLPKYYFLEKPVCRNCGPLKRGDMVVYDGEKSMCIYCAESEGFITTTQLCELENLSVQEYPNQCQKDFLDLLKTFSFKEQKLQLGAVLLEMISWKMEGEDIWVKLYIALNEFSNTTTSNVSNTMHWTPSVSNE